MQFGGRRRKRTPFVSKLYITVIKYLTLKEERFVLAQVSEVPVYGRLAAMFLGL